MYQYNYYAFLYFKNSNLDDQNKNLGGLRFGVDGDGNYGYYGADDSLIPFKSSKANVFGSSSNSFGLSSNYTQKAVKFDYSEFDSSYFSVASNGEITVKKDCKCRICIAADMYKNGDAGCTLFLNKNGSIILGKNSSSLTTGADYKMFANNSGISLKKGDKLVFNLYAIAWSGHSCGCHGSAYLSMILC